MPGEIHRLVPCPHCGKNLPEGAKACIHCGGSLIAQPAQPQAIAPVASRLPTPAVDPDSLPVPDRCPNCGGDSIRRITGVAADGISAGAASIGILGTPIVGASVKESAARLAMPTKPLPPAKPGFESGCGIGCCGFVVLAALASLVDPKQEKAGAVMLLLIGLPLGWYLIYSRGEAEKKYNARLVAHELDLHAWESELTIWRRLYVCTKCDSVIDPASGKSVPTEHIRQLLR